MTLEWSIRHWPRVSYHTFLSHAAEDRQRLVYPVYRALQSEGVLPWLDRHNYPTGGTAVTTLFEEVLRCRHVVFFITPALLRQGRGWPAVERTIAEVIQQQLTFRGTEFSRVVLPLLFVPSSHPVLVRSIWQPLVERAAMCLVSRGKRESRVGWAVRQILNFLRENDRRIESVQRRLKTDQDARSHFAVDPNLIRRIRGTDPVPFTH